LHCRASDRHQLDIGRAFAGLEKRYSAGRVFGQTSCEDRSRRSTTHHNEIEGLWHVCLHWLAQRQQLEEDSWIIRYPFNELADSIAV
jgi:hypothetical protein